jgi:hypothetical protein
MSAKRLSSKDFELYLKTLLDNDGPKFKYKNPTAWRVNPFSNMSKRQ